MEDDSDTGFFHGFDPSDYNYRMLSFQADGVNSSADMNSVVMCSSSGNNTVGSFPSGTSDILGSSSANFNAGTSFGSGHREWVRGLKHDKGLAVDWTYEEQNMLKEGLIRYAGESQIMKYIKIAASLPNKSARDVALRIRWLVKHEIAKRHKLEEYCAGKRTRERREKMMHSYLSRNINIVAPNNSSFSPMTHHASFKKKNSVEAVSGLDGSTQQLMDETTYILSRIATNLNSFKLQANVDLFCHTRNSILSILNSMSSMPGIMRQMPPLPISVNDELLCSILPNTSQCYSFLRSYIRGWRNAVTPESGVTRDYTVSAEKPNERDTSEKTSAGRAIAT